jgi:O-antigen/teichoic acid export membrane protein
VPAVGKELPTRLLKSAVALSAGQLLNILGNLLLVPLFLSRWSTGQYGEWMALSAVVAYFGVTDLGMNSAAGNAMTAAYARGDIERYRFLQGSAMAFYVGMALVMSISLGCLIVLVPIPAWIGVRQIPLWTASWVVWVLAARILWQMPAAQVGTIYRSTGNLAATQWFGNLQALGLLVATVAVLLFHGGVLQLALWGSAPLLVVTLGAWRALRRSHPQLLPRLSAARIAGIRELMGPSLMFGLIMISVALTVQGPVLLVSAALGGTSVALLVITRTLASVMRQITGMLNTALWPELTRLDATGSAESLRFSYRLMVFGSAAFCTAFAGTLWFEGAEVISVWTGRRLVPDIWLLRLFLIALVLQTPWLASGLFTAASNRHRGLSYSYAGSAVLSVITTAILVRPCGLIAVPIGVILGDAVACYHFVIKDTCRMLNLGYVSTAARLWIGVGEVSLAAWAAAWLGHCFAFGPAPLRWLQVGAVTTLASALTAWGLVMGRSDRSRLVSWGKSRWSASRPAGTEVPV